MTDLKNRPENVPLALYSLIRDMMPLPLRKFFTYFFFNISPDIPYDLSKRIKEKNYWRVILYGAFIGFVFCFITTVGFCYYEGVLFPSQCQLSQPECINVVFFSKDYVNIIMYTIITPATMGIGLALLLATIMTWRKLDYVLERERSTLIDWKGFIIVTLIIVVSSIAISNYINDVVNTQSIIGKKANDLHFWFLGNPADKSVIKPITVYYTILNFLILVFTLACIAVFVTAIRPIIKLSNSISKQHISLEETQENLVERMAYFADVYLFAKLLLAITMIHSFVWSWSPLALTNNFNIERGFILVVSIFFIAVPRLHFELEWYRAAISYKQQGVEIDLKPNYIRGSHYYAIWIADYVVIGGYAISLTGILNFGPYA